MAILSSRQRSVNSTDIKLMLPTRHSTIEMFGSKAAGSGRFLDNPLEAHPLVERCIKAAIDAIHTG